MKEILKFVGLFLILYASLIYVCNLNPIKSIINSFFRKTVEVIIKSSLPEAYIETQKFMDKNQQVDPNIFYLVYGNPAVINAEHEFANKQGLKEYSISTHSIQFYIFQMLTVPIVFLISIFGATPMTGRSKVKSLAIGLLLLFLLILFKCILFALYRISSSNIGIYELSDSSLSIVSRLVMILTLGFSIIYSFCLWLLFGFRNSVFSTQFNNFINSFQK